ncbi:MAG: hypothetical protein U0324_43255 [Polyangiales bacterium]
MARATAAARSNALIEKTRAAALARNKARLDELVAEIQRRLTTIVEGFYDVGEHLGEIVDKRLYLADGHETFDAFLAAARLMSPRQAAKLIAVSRSVPRSRALALGQERAYALLSYAKASNDDAALLAEDAKLAGRPVAEVSVREIVAATQVARAEHRGERPKTDAARDRERADAELRRALREKLRDAGAGRPEVTVGRGRVRVELTRAQAERLAGIA